MVYKGEYDVNELNNLAVKLAFTVAVINHSIKHSIASMDVSMKSNTFALQNIKQRIWQAVKILKGYWSFTTKSQRQVEYQRSTTGMCFQHKNLDYKSLKDLVGKLEVLCLLWMLWR